MREALESVPGVVGALHDPARHAHRRGPRGNAGRHLGAHLRTGPRRARPSSAQRGRTIMRGVEGIADLRVEQLDGPAAAPDRGRSRRQRRASGSRRGTSSARCGSVSPGEEASRDLGRTAPLRSRSAAAGRRAAATSPRSARFSSTDTTGRGFPLGQLATIEETSVPAPSGARRGAGESRSRPSVAGRDLGSVAADVRRRLGRDLELPQATSSTSVAASRARSAPRDRSSIAIGVAVVAVFILLLPRPRLVRRSR